MQLARSGDVQKMSSLDRDYQQSADETKLVSLSYGIVQVHLFRDVITKWPSSQISGADNFSAEHFRTH